MHNYLDTIENKIIDKKIGKILFNKYYNIKDLYWTIFYTIAFSLLAGIGNAFTERGFDNIISAFIQAFLNNAYLGFFVNIFQSRLIAYLSTTMHFRLYGNITAGTIQIGFIVWHTLIGTLNPLQTNVLPAIMAFSLINYHMSVLKRRNK